jgi:hypothetical protein
LTKGKENGNLGIKNPTSIRIVIFFPFFLPFLLLSLIHNSNMDSTFALSNEEAISEGKTDMSVLQV